MTIYVWLAAVVVLLGVAAIWYRQLRSRDLGSSADAATFETLHTATLAEPGLRHGLTATGAERAVKHLRALLGTDAVALTDRTRVLAVDGVSRHDAETAIVHSGRALEAGRTVILRGDEVSCGAPDCPVRAAVACPLVDGDTVIGALVAYSRDTSALLVRAVEEVAHWVSGQLELASAEAHRTRMMEAELRALRAQISPHFVYNSLSAIASFIRTDPEQARELVLEFADFTRYALRRGGEFATLAEELHNTERYLMLEQARFGDRLRVQLRVAPEVLPTKVPFLVLQPLVENAVRHGLEEQSGTVTVSIRASDAGADAVLVVEDDGVGADSGVIRQALEGPSDVGARGGAVGLGNVDARLRQIYGDRYGLVLETAPGAGTKVTVRVPKFAARASADPLGTA